MLARLLRHAEKTFDLPGLIRALPDPRKRPQIPLTAIWSSAMAMFALRCRSLHSIAGHLRAPGRLDRMTGPVKPSDDTMGRVFAGMDTAPLRAVLTSLARQLARNKALESPWPLRFAAVDGHELFKSRSRHCPGCCERTINVDGKEVVEYFHRVVVCHLVGLNFPLPLDLEPVAPGEGEIAAARRVLERVFSVFPRLFDAVCGDALYFEAPFFNFCIEHRKHVVAVLKGDRRLLLKDAKGLFDSMTPVRREERGREILLWDEENFTSAEGVARPLRVVRTEETPLERRIAKRSKTGGTEKTEEPQETPGAVKDKPVKHWCWATTIPKKDLPARQLAQAGHARWDIENDNFNDLSTHWGLDHCYKHDPAAILNFILTLFITFVTLKSFHLRHVKDPRIKALAFIALAHEFLAGIDHCGHGPWWSLNAHPPP